jgi:uncharacterized phiE125 gp8 family phage protein
MATYRQLTEPASEPLTYQQVKDFLRLNGDTEQTFVTSLITVARQQVESRIWRPLISQTMAFQLDYDELKTTPYNINKAPLVSFQSVTYYDVNDTLQTLAASNYEVDIYGSPARFRLKNIPQCFERMNTLQVNFTCGYANAAAVPSPIIQAMYMIIGHLYENRQDVVTGTQVNEIPHASEFLLEPYRNNFIFAPLI